MGVMKARTKNKVARPSRRKKRALVSTRNPKSVSPEDIVGIIRMLNYGYSSRTVSSMMRYSRELVNKLASGVRPKFYLKYFNL
jgi:hypothetical protein